ncbi:hypothetical protein [Nocardia sp. NPDC057668]|uniref:hypothetical protein n=1 Tax=Nocardia sp. NPDC057668 TaxID=3346202 RepID=UPI00366C8DB6
MTAFDEPAHRDSEPAPEDGAEPIDPAGGTNAGRPAAPPAETTALPEPEVLPEHREQARRMAESYEDGRPHTVLPGSDGMVAGTAVHDWLDDRGRPKFDTRTAAEREQHTRE